MTGLFLTAMAFTTMIINYILINCMLRNTGTPSREEDRLILRKTLVLIGTDMLCWLPTLFFGLIRDYFIKKLIYFTYKFIL